jgi:hypothetical protein
MPELTPMKDVKRGSGDVKDDVEILERKCEAQL